MSDLLTEEAHKHSLDIIGYDHIESQIAQMIRDNRLPHAFIFAGDKGRGKESFAIKLSRALQSRMKENFDDLSVATNDPIISRLEQESHPDFKIVRRQNKKNKSELSDEIVIDSVRGASHFFDFKAVESKHRIVIVDEADSLNVEAQNAFLKTLEEPPAGALLILIAHRPAKLLATIRSRAQVIQFDALSEDILKEQGGVALTALEPDIQTRLLRLSRGGIGALKAYLEEDVIEAVTKIHDILINWDMTKVQDLSESWGSATLTGFDTMDLLREMIGDDLYARLMHDLTNENLLHGLDAVQELFDVAKTRYLDKRQVIREALTIYKASVK